MGWPVDIFHVGPQKTGTTWVYKCFSEHPKITTPNAGSVHYYSMFYHKGDGWYRNQFPRAGKERILFDPTENYFRSPFAARRIFDDNPDAKIIICLREPIERAFSHYWHENKKGRFNFKFEEVFSNFDLFTNWIEPGLYSVHIKRFLDLFPQRNVRIVFFDDLEANPGGFIKDLYEFVGVDSGFVPSVVDKKVNVAGRKQRYIAYRGSKLLRDSINKFDFEGLSKYIRNSRFTAIKKKGGSVAHKLRNLPGSTLHELSGIVGPEIDALEDLLKIDLSHWRSRYSGIFESVR